MNDPAKMVYCSTKRGRRYTFEFGWESGDGHIITAFKDDNDEVVLYDPQSNVIIEKKERTVYLSAIKYDYKDGETPNQLLRIDNLQINEKVANGILEKR